MICSKCGEQCNDNQAFCLKCGNPMQLMADFNLIEKELASSIGEFMDEIENEGTELPDSSEESDAMKTIDVPLDEINMQLKLVDINRDDEDKDIDDILLDDDLSDDWDDEDITPVYVPKNRQDQKKNNVKKSNKKLYIIIGCVVAVIAIVAIILIFVLPGNKEDENVTKDYAYYYSNADKSYDNENYDEALDMALEAVKLAENDADKIKARELVKLIYDSQNFTGKYYFENIAELYALSKEQEYVSVLLNYYVEQKDTENLVKLYYDTDEAIVKEVLGENYIEKPQANVPAGQYNNYITIDFSTADGCQVFYAVSDDTNKVDNSQITYTLYEKSLEIIGEGQYKVVAYAVNEQGIASYIAEYDYSIVAGESEGPVISPEAGTYNEPTQITIDVPEGSKAYYTYDGTMPSQDSTEYTEPVDMLRDVNTFKAILVDKYGNISEATSVQYNLRIPRNETLTSGSEKVWQYYYNNGLIDIDGNQADGSVISITYNDLKIIDNSEYYIYEVVATSADGTSTTAITYCAVNTFDGTVAVGIIEAGDDFVIPEEEE